MSGIGEGDGRWRVKSVRGKGRGMVEGGMKKKKRKRMKRSWGKKREKNTTAALPQARKAVPVAHGAKPSKKWHSSMAQ